MMPIRPRLTPAIADVRRAVRGGLQAFVTGPATGREPAARTTAPPEAAAEAEKSDIPLVLVALSGGADSLALAAATAFEGPRHGIRAGAVIVDHGLQAGSAEVASRAREQATALGLEPVVVIEVQVDTATASAITGGPEAAARTARYSAFRRALADTGASHLLLGHTLDDQAETVLLGLARGSGARSLQGMAAATGPWLRPLLGIRRSQTVQFCSDAGLTAWHDPHNQETRFARVRVRQSVLPVLEGELGGGVAAALARTAEQLREDADVLDTLAATSARTITRRINPAVPDTVQTDSALNDAVHEGAVRDDAVHDDTVQLDAAALLALPAALRNRVIRLVIREEFQEPLSRQQTLEVARLVTHWRGQGELHLPRIRVVRAGGWLNVSAATGGSHGTNSPEGS